MQARIYKPSKSAMTSGRGKTKLGCLNSLRKTSIAPPTR